MLLCSWLAVVRRSVLEAFQLSELRFSSAALHSCTRDDQNRETEEKEKREEGKEVTGFFVDAEKNNEESIIFFRQRQIRG